ncbi:pyruvate kinase [Corynebacterium alimapuense]|uniref:pyruvate kinase n=1 Tax=Corynebacterium alimapuense TaxID=1576874 RepID=A0A3M8K9W7_9CORY|nr:pyruvate kinase [Corynebacterium alimapuense]RNE50013.1 pyruvate kinase [Corynebacterium alimapuense]
MDARLQTLINDVDALIRTLLDEERRQAPAISKVAPSHRDGAVNLIHYAELRQHDIRALQAELSALGATRLTTTEPAVLTRLKAARNVLSAFAGEELVYSSSEVSDGFAVSDDILEEHATALFGDSPEETHSRIMVTLPGEAGHDLDLVRGFAQAGMELARINCAHDGPEVWERMIEHVHTAAAEVGREIKIGMDLAGPKVRTGAIAPGAAVGRARVTRTETGQVLTPAKLWLTPVGYPALAAPDLPGRPCLAVQVDGDWLSRLAPGSEISLLDNRDSRRHFNVTQIEPGQPESTVPAAVLAEGQRNAYIANSTLLEHDWEKTRVSGIEPTERKLRLAPGDHLILCDEQVSADPTPGTTPRISCTLPEAVAAIEVGQRVQFDDGAIAALAIGKQSTDDGYVEIELEVIHAAPGGTNLAAYKGINLPETTLPLPSLTEEDIAALNFVVRNADIAHVSFIRDSGDVEFLLSTLADIAETAETEEIAERARNLGVVLKIETIPAFENLPQVLLEGMRHPNLGIMIARGDLAVELGFDRMAEVPRLISQMAEAAHVPTVMATQVLENMAKAGLPSRAEITDAAYALRSEVVMLNKGPHITDAINILHRMSTKLGRSQRKNRQLLRRIRSWGVEQQPAE